jgi:hypothetical protein
MEKNLVFVKGFAGKAKSTGKPFCSIDFIDNHSVNSFDGRSEVKMVSCFLSSAPALLDSLVFGDVVTCQFDVVDLTGKPQLVDIFKVVQKSPYAVVNPAIGK